MKLALLAAMLAAPCAYCQNDLRAPTPKDSRQVEPINLAAALQLAQVRALDIQVATERIAVAEAQLQLARSRWLPNVLVGGDYAWHNGRIQDIVGNVFSTNRESTMVGVGPAAQFSPAEAIFAPLAAKQVVLARRANRRAAENDTLLAVAEAYFEMQRARGDLAGSLEAERLAAELVRRAEKLAAGLAPPVEVHRAKAELARRRQSVELASERWEIASAEVSRILRLPPAVLVRPTEAPDLQITLLDDSMPVDELIPVGLTMRPELSAQQALVNATLARLKQEKLRPLIPSVVWRGNAANPGGTLSSGIFGGGVNGDLSNYGWRNSMDVQVLWELQGLGFGNHALIKEREAENRAALLELFRVQDRVAADIAQAHSQATRAAARAVSAQDGLKEALQTVKTSLEGLSQTRRMGESLVLIFRPQEVVAAVQSLETAYRDYFAAIAEANRAQFRLYRALGQPAQWALANKKTEKLPEPKLPPATDQATTVLPTTVIRRPIKYADSATDRRP